MKFFKKKPETKKPEEAVRSESIDVAYIDKLLSGDKKIPVAPEREKPGTPTLPFMPFVAAICFLLALVFFFVSLYLHRRLDALATEPTQSTTTVPTTLPATTLPKPTEPTETEPTEPPLRFDTIKQGEVTYLVPNKTLELSLREYYCTSPNLPIPEDDAPAEDWLLFFYSLLADEDSWYHRALTSHYTCPEQINMENLLYRGIAQGGSPLESYPEAQWLMDRFVKPEVDVVRLPKSDINSLVGVYFGTTIEDHTIPYYRYNEQTGCYYFAPSSFMYTSFLGIVSYEWLEDGNVSVRYAGGTRVEPVLQEMVLRPVDRYFQIVSNLPAPTEPVTIDLEDIPVISGSVYEPGSMFVEPGYSGNAMWGKGNDFAISLPLLEPFCEGAKEINAEIKSIFQPIIDEVRTNIVYQTSPRYWKIYYKSYQSEDVLSIIITRVSMSDTEEYTIFNLDLSTGEALDQYEMIRRYTGMSYPEFLLRANFTVTNYLGKEYPMESEEVTNWLSRLEKDVWVMNGHQLFLDHEGTLYLANHSVRSWIDSQIPLQIPFDPNACGEEFTDWERESYEWLFDIRTDGAYATTMSYVLRETFFFAPEQFLQYLSAMSDERIQTNARLLVSELFWDHGVAPLLACCREYQSQSHTAKAAQVILDELAYYEEAYPDYH